MADMTLRGRFVWHELNTADESASHAFYRSVLGWKTHAWEQNPSYQMFSGGGEPLGATVAKEGGAHWIHYIGTSDLDATLQQAQSLGATVVQEPGEIPGGDRYAVLQDPQGAVFAVYASSTPPQREKDPRVGQFSWMELVTTDAKAALDFYCELFGWERSAAHDMGPMGFYYIFSRNGRDIGGAFDKPAQMSGPSAWLGYVRGKDLDAIARKVREAGGTLLNGPMEVPGGDWIAQFADPHGAMFAVHVLKNDLAQHSPSIPEPGTTQPPATTRTVRKQVARTTQKSAKKDAARAAKKPVTAKAGKKSTKKKSTKKKSTAAAGKKAAKSGKRSARKASRVRSRSVQAKSRTTGRKKAAVRTGRKRAQPKKGK
jgi:predicted enzyme related to lactoylglutathione lyase